MSDRIIANQLAWKGETPWHGKGHKVPENATGEQMLEIAGLNWKVQTRSLAMRGTNGHSDQVLTEPLQHFKAIVRADTDEVFQVATDKYHPVQNAQIVDYFKRYCDAGHATMETVGGIDGGSKIFALARLNGKTDAKIGGVDEVRGYMLLATSHDGSLQTVGKPTQTRVVCWNTLSAALGLYGGKLGKKDEREFRRKHSAEWTSSVVREAQQTMGMALESLQATNELSEKLSQVRIDTEGRLEFLEKLLLKDGSLLETVVDEHHTSTGLLDKIVSNHQKMTPAAREKRLGRVGKAVIDAILHSPGSSMVTTKDTLWGAVNGVTWFADHVRGRSEDTRLSNAWFGAGDHLKTDALTVAAQMAGVR